IEPEQAPRAALQERAQMIQHPRRPREVYLVRTRSPRETSEVHHAERDDYFCGAYVPALGARVGALGAAFPSGHLNSAPNSLRSSRSRSMSSGRVYVLPPSHRPCIAPDFVSMASQIKLAAVS